MLVAAIDQHGDPAAIQHLYASAQQRKPSRREIVDRWRIIDAPGKPRLHRVTDPTKRHRPGDRPGRRGDSPRSARRSRGCPPGPRSGHPAIPPRPPAERLAASAVRRGQTRGAEAGVSTRSSRSIRTRRRSGARAVGRSRISARCAWRRSSLAWHSGHSASAASKRSASRRPAARRPDRSRPSPRRSAQSMVTPSPTDRRVRRPASRAPATGAT